MGRRGPAAKRPEELKPNPTGVRLSAELRRQLEKEAQEHGVTLSQEISSRLEQSFQQDSRKIGEFGDYSTYAFCRLMAETFSFLRQSTGQPWHKDRFTFGHAKDAADFLFEQFRPTGRDVQPPDMPAMKEAKAESPLRVRMTKQEIAERTFGPSHALVMIFTIMRDLEWKQLDKRFAGIAHDIKARLLKSHVAEPGRLPMHWLGDIFFRGIEGKKK